jgi:uncharacterized protein (UPF0548 family)
MPVTGMPAETADRLRGAPLTYAAAGRTAGVFPPGYRHISRRAVIGSGDAVFSAAATALLTWQAHLRAGLRVSASSPAAEPGGVVLLGLRVGPICVRAPCRVIYVTDEPARRGFAYGTLPGHPESGEEAFMIHQEDNGTVTFIITAFSRPATPLARIIGPAGRALQDHLTTRYLRALAS